jgi:uncharacterized protein (DUF1330 family)
LRTGLAVRWPEALAAEATAREPGEEIPMAAYFIVNIGVRDREKFETYRERVVPVIEKFGGRYLVRGGELHPIEGDLGLNRLVVLEFPSMEAARRFYDSPEYAPLLKLRQESAESDIVLAEGWTPTDAQAPPPPPDAEASQATGIID